MDSLFSKGLKPSKGKIQLNSTKLCQISNSGLNSHGKNELELKSSQVIPIYHDTHQDNKRPSSHSAIDDNNNLFQLKKRKIVDENETVRGNEAPICSELTLGTSNLVAVTNKRIVLSDEEKNMNGAPEGELFDVVVLSDEDLPSIDIHDSIVDEIIKLYRSTNLWNERYIFVENIRKLIKYHSQVISVKELPDLAEIATLELNSLRSCSIRNGIFLSRQLITEFPRLLMDSGHLVEILNHFVIKMSSGPRFIGELALDSFQLCLANTQLRFEEKIDLMMKNVSHKSADVAGKMQLLLAEHCSVELKDLNTEITLSSTTFSNLCEGLYVGINSKRAFAKEKTRSALAQLVQRLGKENFLERCTNAQVPVSRRNELLHALESKKSALQDISGNHMTSTVQSSSSKRSLKDHIKMMKSSSSTSLSSSSLSSSSSFSSSIMMQDSVFSRCEDYKDENNTVKCKAALDSSSSSSFSLAL